MLDPLTTDLSALMLHTPATLATLSLEVPPGSVLLEGTGMGHLQLVSVNGIEFVLHINFVECMFTISGTCSDLPPLMNGVIAYDTGPADSRPINTLATFTCDNGYTSTLTRGSFRVCQNDGTWSGTTPTCQCEFHYILTVASPFQY